MKYKISILIGLLVAFLAGCKKDNYDAPASWLTGRVVFQNQPVGVRSNGVQLELWQPGYAVFAKIPVYVKYDGTFSANVFDGEYKLTRLKGNGPWADNTDTINVSVKGTANIDVPVDAYFVVKNDTYSRTGNTITATFSLQRGNTTKNLELVRMYVGQTLLTDQSINMGTVDKAAAAIPDLTQPITLSINVPAGLQAKDYVFVRIGVKTAGVAELAYGEPEKVNLK